MGTGINLSERFKGLNPWNLSSLEDEFEQQSTSTLSLSDVLKLSSLAITVNGKSKSGHPKATSSKKYASTSLHKLFSQKSTGKKEKTEKVTISKDVAVDQKKRVNGTNAGKSNSEKSGEVPEKGAIREKPSTGKTHTDGSKQTIMKPLKGSVNLLPNGVTPSAADRPRDPRLLYGKGPYNILAKKPEAEHQKDKPENPVKNLKSFGESLTLANRTGLEAVGKKPDGDKTIQVVKRNAVTKKITGIVQMNVKRKPLQNTDQNKPSVTDYHSSHNALKKISEAKKADSATGADVSSAAVITPKALKGILKKDIPSVDSVETNEKGTESADTLSTQASACKCNELKEDKSKQAMTKQITNPKKHVKSKVKGSTKIVKPKLGVKKKKVSRTPNHPNIVLKLSFTPSIDNGKLNLTVVSSSEDDQVKSDSNDQNGQVNIPLSIENSSQAVVLSTDEAKEFEKPKQVPVTDEELKKGSPIQVRISNGVNGHTPRSSACMNTLNDVSSNVEDNAHNSVGPDRARTEPSPVVTSGCVYTTAGKTAQVSTHQSVVKMNNRPPIHISYVFGTAVSSNKTEPVSAQTVHMPYQSGHDMDVPQVQQYTSTTDQYTVPQNGYQGNEIWQPGIVTQTSTESVPSSICQSVAQDTNVCLTESTPIEVHGGCSLASHSDPKEHSKYQHTTGNMPITVRIQQNVKNGNKVIHKETGCKPVHRTLTEITRVTETEKSLCIGADNLDVVDMDISTPTRHVPNSIEEMSIDPNTVSSCSVESGSIVPPSLLSDKEKNITSSTKESKTAGEKESEVIGSLGGSDGEGKSRVVDQQAQTASWTTYLHEDTISPMKSAFGSKQSFTEALSSLQKTMQESSDSADPETSTDEATTPGQVMTSPKDPSPSTHVHLTSQIDATDTESLSKCRPTQGLIPANATPVSQDIPKESSNSVQLDGTLPYDSDAPTAVPDPNPASENASVQNTLRMKITDSSKTVSVTNQSEILTVNDGRNSVSVSKAIGSAESVNCDKPESEEKIGEVLKNAGMVVSCVPSDNIINRCIFEEASRRSKSPGTPVEDECFDKDPFGPNESMHYEVQSKPEHFVSSDNQGHGSFRYEEEENNNNCNEKQIDLHHELVKNGRHKDQSDLPRQYNRGNNRYPDSPRNRQAGPVYLRELSNVSDISMGDNEFATFEDGQNQEALEPLLVRGSARDTGGMDHSDYPRDDTVVSRRETCEVEREHSDRNMSIHSRQETDSRFMKPAPRIEGYDNQERVYPHPCPEEREPRYKAPNRPTHRYREEQNPNSQMYVKSDNVPARRDGGGQLKGTSADPMIMEQMTAVQALQLQINAAINPAHRAALVMALQALTGVPVKSTSGEVQPEVKTSTMSDRHTEFRDMSDDVTSQRLRDDSVREDPSPRKVEFTVVLRGDEAEQLLRKDSCKRSRTEDKTKVQRHSYDAEERYPDSSAQHRHDSHYYRNTEYKSDTHTEYPRQDGIRKDRTAPHERTFEVHRGNSEPLEDLDDSDGERRTSSKARHGQSISPNGRPIKPKKSTSKKSKKKSKEFHGRPLIKDKSNRTNPLSIPLDNEDIVIKRNDPRRSLTPDPVCAPKEFRPLSWPPTPGGGSKTMLQGKGKKLKQKDKKRLSKPNAFIPCSKNPSSKQKETVGGPLNSVSYADTLIKGNVNECMTEKCVHPEVVCNKDGKKFSEGAERAQIEITDKPDHVVEKTIEAFVNEARLASKHMEIENKEQYGNIAGEGFTSLEHFRNDQEIEDKSRLDTSRESVTPRSSPSGGKKKSKSPDSKKYKHSDDEERKCISKITPQKRKLCERSPERHRKHRDSESERDKPRHKRMYSSDSESDIDSDREHVRETGNKLKRYGHFSRFTKGQDCRSARNGPVRHGFAMRHRTPFQRFNHKKYIYPGNLGKPYGNQKVNFSFRGRGRGGFRGRAPLHTPWRNKGYSIDITREAKNSPNISMARLGYKSIDPWQDVHVALTEIKAKMLAVENSSREVRKASSQLQVAPLLKVHQSALSALQCILEEVGGRISYDRREMYLHRRKYEILMADIRIHAEVLGKLIPRDQEEEMLSEFVPNTTGIPQVEPAIELKVMNWLRLMNHSGMLLACKDLVNKKIRSLQRRLNALRPWDKKLPGRADDRTNRPAPKRRQWSESDRSPDTTEPECGYRRDAGQWKSGASPEVLSCPEFGLRTPETPAQPIPESFSEIRLPTHHHMIYPEGYPQSGPSTAFRDPPEPVRQRISSCEENLGLMDIPMHFDDDENVSFNIVDILPNEGQRQVERDQCAEPVPNTEVVTEFIAADSSSVDMKDAQATPILSPECPFVPQVRCDSATPPCTSSGFVNSFKPFHPLTYTPRPNLNFYISRVQRLASRTLMSPESGSDLQTLLKSEAEKSLKRSKSQRSPSSLEEPSGQGDMAISKCEPPKSPRYSKKRHFLAKYQSDGHETSPKGDLTKQLKPLEPLSTKITKSNLNSMYDEYDESCLGEESAKVDTHGLVSSPPSSNSESVPIKGGPL